MTLETRPGQQASLKDSISGGGPCLDNGPETEELREGAGTEEPEGWGGGTGDQRGKVRAHCQELRPRSDRLMGSGQGC